jgi:H+/Cl- antiporter ClcA
MKLLRWTFLSALSGVLAGIAAAIFLISLDFATQYRQHYPQFIWALPIAGLLIGLLYHYYGKEVSSGHNLILDEIHDPKKIVPLRMAPLVLLGTIATHLFGGSAGREGTAVQMGASLSDQIGRFFKIETHERRALLMAGASAGFGAAIGAPWAGWIFGMEVLHTGRFKLTHWYPCLVASFVGYFVTILLKAPHSVYPSIVLPSFEMITLFWVAVAGIAFGLAARFFILSTHWIEKLSVRWIAYAPLRPFIGGLLLIVLFSVEGSYQYVGLGIESIQQALQSRAQFHEPLLKSLFTSLTVGSGFKGGEFIPLVFIGTTLGSALSMILPVALPLLASLGFAAVFAGAANTPIACTLMAMEIFGIGIAPYALLTCLISYSLSGRRGIYKSQRTS